MLAASLAALSVLWLGIRDGGTYSWDRGLVTFFDEHYYDYSAAREAIEAAVRGSIVFGLVGAAGLFAVLVAARARRRAAFWGLTIAGSLALTRILKELIERPEIGVRSAEYSFPSGNATASAAGVFALTLLLGPSRWRKSLVTGGCVVVLAYGFALVLLLWHYPSDVVAGWALATAWVSALRLTFGSVRRLP